MRFVLPEVGTEFVNAVPLKRINKERALPFYCSSAL
jgi:hypothetical protein